MPRDLFAEAGIDPNAQQSTQGAPRDLFAEAGIEPPQQQGLIPRIASDIDVGGAQMGANILRHIPGIGQHFQNVDYSQVYGAPQQPGLLDKLVQGAAQYAPYSALGALAPGLAGQAAIGGLYGATQSDSPVSGAITGALAGAAGETLAKGINFLSPGNLRNYLSNKILESTRAKAAQGLALSPEEAAQHALNYTGAQGQQLPVDIGTLTNQGFLGGLYDALKYVPGSGVANRINLIRNQLAQKGIQDVQGQAAQAFPGLGTAPTTADINTQLGNLTQQQGQVRSAINEQLSHLDNQHNQLKAALDVAPNALSDLASGIDNRQQITKTLKDAAQQLYKSHKEAANALYEPINNSKLRLDAYAPDKGSLFPTYANQATELLAQRGNLEEIFGSDSDLKSVLNTELNKAQSLLSGYRGSGVTLNEAVQRIQNLGKLAARAFSQGNRNEARLLGNLQNGLRTDVDNILRTSGNSNLADTLHRANEYYSNNVVPFWQNSVIQKAVEHDFIPQQGKLSAALHDPNNHGILSQLPQNIQNASLYQLLTKGKGTSAGLSNLAPDEIAKAYQGLPVDAKTAISQYNPQIDQYFEGLPQALQHSQEFDTAKTQLSDLLKEAEKHFEGSKKSLTGLQDQLKAAQTKRFGTKQEDAGKAGKAAALLKGGALLGSAYLMPKALLGAAAGIPLTRYAGNLLSNPELIKAYLSGGSLPMAQSTLAPAARRALPYVLTPSIVNGGQR